jgi:hypothetical protein
MRWLILLLLVTAVWFLVHVAEAVDRALQNQRRSRPRGTSAGSSLMAGMLVMPISFLGAAALVDRIWDPLGVPRRGTSPRDRQPPTYNLRCGGHRPLA